MTQLSLEVLQTRLTPDENGETYYGEPLAFMQEIPRDDKGYWMDVPDNAAILIKGEIIIPRAVEVVRKYEVD